MPTLAPPRTSAVRLAFFAAGLLLAVVTCGGILEQRLSSGSPRVALVANGLLTFAAILVLGLVQRRESLAPAGVLPQALGATLGIVAVHAALRLGLLPEAPWMSERPPQLVNDAVAVFSTLAVVWACARGLRLRLLIGALLLLTVYRATAHFWHLDAAPQGFLVTVQDLVVAEVVALALALGLYRGMVRRAV
ncbi:MAG TPA: hypothetical protein VGG39_26555 [Polyangiaceae bacterium]